MTQQTAHPFDLTDRTALITGGAKGIGSGIATVLAEANATVVIADVDKASADEMAGKLSVLGKRAGAVRIDLAEEASIVRGCTEVLSTYGTPWLLVNNAGLQDRELLLDGTTAEWDRMNIVNARGPFLMTREIGRAMAATGQGGRIVNIASTALIGSLVKGLAAYASSKGALLALSAASAFELAGHAITVNTILPGGVATPGSIGAKGPPPEGPGRRLSPLGMCEPHDIGAAVLYFAAPAARYVTNQVLAIDAGWSVT
jgi:NAD(P)-dependent dehydrogenase (short-subunit alcohol dehydrogenase family)